MIFSFAFLNHVRDAFRFLWFFSFIIFYSLAFYSILVPSLLDSIIFLSPPLFYCLPLSPLSFILLSSSLPRLFYCLLLHCGLQVALYALPFKPPRGSGSPSRSRARGPTRARARGGQACQRSARASLWVEREREGERER